MNVFTILSDLASDNSRNFKIAYLKKYADNELVKRVFAMALDPLVVFHIKKIPTINSSGNVWTLDQALTMLDGLSNRAVTGNAAIEHLRTILCNVSEDDGEVIKRVISKDLRCGVSIATAAVVWPEFSKFNFPVMLASAFDQKLIDKLEYSVFCQQKMDGTRFAAIVDGDNVSFFTRNGKFIDIPNNDLFNVYAKLGQYYGFPIVFDGELLVVDNNEQVLERKTSNGIINKAVKGTMSVQEAQNIRTVIWDAIPLIDFRYGRYNVAYQTRFDALQVALATLELSMINLHHYVSLVPTALVDSYEEIQQIFDEYIKKGYEGVIVKNRDMIWENKRSKSQIKLKAEEDLDALVVGWVPGTGKNEGLMGALVCRCDDIEFNLGTGFSEEERRQFTADYIVGKIVAVTYNQIISDKTTGIKSLFLPRFTCVRFDKDVV